MRGLAILLAEERMAKSFGYHKFSYKTLNFRKHCDVEPLYIDAGSAKL